MTIKTWNTSVSVFCRIIFGGYDETTAFTGPSIYRLDDVDHFLFILNCPVDLVVVTCSQIYHNMLIPEEKHGSAGIVQLVPNKENEFNIKHIKFLHKIQTYILLKSGTWVMSTKYMTAKFFTFSAIW